MTIWTAADLIRDVEALASKAGATADIRHYCGYAANQWLTRGVPAPRVLKAFEAVSRTSQSPTLWPKLVKAKLTTVKVSR